MKQFKIFGWMGILMLIILSSCREDIIKPIEGDPTFGDPIIKVVSTIKGRVIDEANFPIQDVVVSIDGNPVITDKNGVFLFDNMEFNKNGTLISAEKSGYYIGSKMVNPELGTESFTLIQLLTKDLTGNFTSSTGGTITTTDNASVTFAANSIMRENGSAYTGTVNVYSKWIDPTHENIDARMPGDLRAVDADDAQVQLATYGMIAVELESPSGEALQINTGNTATISLPIPNEIIGAAPSTIPLWSYDEATGYWIEESSATLQDGQYVGEVSHFSFWNCDAPFPVVQLCGSVVSEEGIPFAWLKLEIEVPGSIGVRYGYTDSEGNFKGKIPKDLTMTIRVLDLCGSVVYEAEIGPFSEDVVLDPIVANMPEPVTVSGVLLNCDMNPIEGAYAYIESAYGFHTFYSDENGVFSGPITICESTDLVIQGFDIENLLTSDPVDLTIPAGATTADAGQILVCQTITEFIHISIPSISYDRFLFDGFNVFDNSASAEGIIVNSQDTVSVNMQILAASMETGSIEVNNVFFADWTGINGTNGIYLSCNGPCANMEVTVNQGTGGNFVGKFTGSLIDEEAGGIIYDDVVIDISATLQ